MYESQGFSDGQNAGRSHLRNSFGDSLDAAASTGSSNARRRRPSFLRGMASLLMPFQSLSEAPNADSGRPAAHCRGIRNPFRHRSRIRKSTSLESGIHILHVWALPTAEAFILHITPNAASTRRQSPAWTANAVTTVITAMTVSAPTCGSGDGRMLFHRFIFGPCVYQRRYAQDLGVVHMGRYR